MSDATPRHRERESDVDDSADDSDQWATVGREAVAVLLEDAHHDVDSAVGTMAVETLRRGDDPSREQVRELRRAVADLQLLVEEYLAPIAADAESWGQPRPRIPMGVLWELTDHPNAEDVDPREYVDGDRLEGDYE